MGEVVSSVLTFVSKHLPLATWTVFVFATLIIFFSNQLSFLQIESLKKENIAFIGVLWGSASKLM